MLKLLARRKISKRKRRRLFVYWLIALILLTAFFVNFFKVISNFIASVNYSSGPKLNFDGFANQKIIGVFVSDPLVLAIFDPIQKKVELIKLPERLYFDLGGRGFYLASKVYQLEQEEKLQPQILAKAIITNLQIPVDFYLDFEVENITIDKILTWPEKITQPSSLFWFFQIPQNSPRVLKTNFTLFDQYKLLWKLRQVRKNKFEIHEVQTTSFEEVIMPDGEEVLAVSTEGLDPQTLSLFSDLEIAKENMKVGIINASGFEGLGESLAQILQNLGIKAGVVGQQEATSVTQILVKEDFKNSLTLQRLSEVLGVKTTTVVDDSQEDIQIVVGADLVQQLRF